MEGSTGIICPTCFEQTTLPVKDLPTNAYLSNQANLSRRLLELKSSGECENCDSKDKACAYCPYCGEGGLRICKQCVKFHGIFRSYRKHTVVGLDSDLTEVVRKEIKERSVVCAKHSDATGKYFCQDCRVLVCPECIVVAHSSHKHKTVESVWNEEKIKLHSAASVLDQALPHLMKSRIALVLTLNDVDARND